MSNHTLSKFKSTLKGGGARPNLFEVTIAGLPNSITLGSDNDTFTILCKSAALPASNIPQIDVPFRGRIFKVAGDRTYDPWTVTIINDEDFSIRNGMERWMQLIGQYGDGSGANDPAEYMASATVRQLGRDNSTLGFGVAEGTGLRAIAQYKFFDIFPTNISQIDLSYDSSDTIEEFTVDFQVQYWTPEQPGNTNAQRNR
jgi:hypothetical protein